MAKLRIYDRSNLNPTGNKENITRCIHPVTDYTGWHIYQCARKRGYGPKGLYCKQHAKQIEERIKWQPDYKPWEED